MKKIGYLLITLIAIFGMVGCGKKDEGEKTFTFSLYSNSSTGYEWTYEVGEEGIIQIEESYDDTGCPEDVAGCGGQKIYKITGLKEGKVTLSLKYHFFTDETRVEDTAIYQFKVDKNLNITETHSGTYFHKK